MLVGAYTAALFTKNSGLDLEIAFPIGLVLAGIAAALFGIVIGIPALRLRGDYLAIITLGFGEIIRVIANNLKITNGAMGLSDINSLRSLKNPSPMFVYSYAIAALVIFIIFNFTRSRHGRAVIAIREDEIAAEAMGINTTYFVVRFRWQHSSPAWQAGIAHQIGLSTCSNSISAVRSKS